MPMCLKSIDVTTQNEKREERRSKSLFLKNSPLSKYIIRPVASRLVHVISKTSITPNQITWMSFAFSLGGGLGFFFGTHFSFVVGGISLQLSLILDSADGILARQQNKVSRFGAYLDLYLDRIGEFLFLVGVAIGYFRYSGNETLLIIALFSIGLHFLQTSLFYIYLKFQENTETGQTGDIRMIWISLILITSLINRVDLIIYGHLAYVMFAAFYLTVRFIRAGYCQD